MRFLALVLSSSVAVPSHAVTLMLEPLTVLGSRIEAAPSGRAIGRVDRSVLEATDAFSLKDLLDKTPGVVAKQSNGPRDISVSLRGSAAKTTFAIRNIKMYEDWFPVTQSDGLSRTDIHDPNAYEGLDAIRGAVNFRTRLGREVDGADAGATVGSHGYQNQRVHLGRRHDKFEYSVFASHIRGDGYTYHNGFKTVTQNAVLRFYPYESRTVVVKLLNNDLEAQVPSRLSRAQSNDDPRSAGVTAVTGVGTVTAQRAAQKRRDRRTILGARYEQRLDEKTEWRFLGAYDVKDINQTFGVISDNTNPNFHHYADLTRDTELGGRGLRLFIGEFFNKMEQEDSSYRNAADGEGTRGALQSNTRGFHQNLGARTRAKWAFAPDWELIAGAGAEQSRVKASVQTRTAAETYSRVDVDRLFYNLAPELALTRAFGGVKARARSGMGYGIPGISQLTTDQSGLAGNNTGLRPQRNLGFELGAGRAAPEGLSWDSAAYYEVFWNEFVTQSPGAGLSNFTANAPRADHRGVELWGDWRHPFGWLEWNRVEGYPVNNHNTLRTRTANLLNLNAHLKRAVRWGPVSRVTLTFDVRNLMNAAYDGSAVTVSDANTDTSATMLTKQSFFAGQGRSVYGGATWGAPARVGPFDWGFNGCPHVGGALAVSGGRLHALVWTGKDGRAGLYASSSGEGGAKWSGMTKVGGPGAKHSDLAAHPRVAAAVGSFRAVWLEKDEPGAAARLVSAAVDARGP